jgi:hypothetical protein
MAAHAGEILVRRSHQRRHQQCPNTRDEFFTPVALLLLGIAPLSVRDLIA